MKMVCGWLSVLLIGSGSKAVAEPENARVRTVIENARGLTDVPFAEVIEGATGQRVLPLDAGRDASLLEQLATIADSLLGELNSQPVEERPERINEVSDDVEDRLRQEINAAGVFRCDVPRTAAGDAQRSGYPDLHIQKATDGVVYYLDVKLHSKQQRNSTLRTFYYSPAESTGKVNEPAVHLLIGFEHDGEGRATRRFTGWRLVDLSRVRLHLKAEFNAPNREIYSNESVIVSGSPSGQAN